MTNPTSPQPRHGITIPMIVAERLRLIDVFDRLDEDGWDTPSLCGGWTVRHVAGHLAVAFAAHTPTVARAMVSARGSFDRAMDRLAREAASAPVDQLVARLRELAPRVSSPPVVGRRAPLADIVIHTQDVARPLGLVVEPDPAVLPLVLGFLSGPLGRSFNVPASARRARLEATDLDWSAGPADAAKVWRAKGLDLALALTGRPAGDLGS